MASELICVTPEDATLLIVDDSRVVRKSLDITLKEAGHKTDSASSGEKALKKVQSLPDLVLLDVHMEPMNGYEVLEAIKSDHLTKKLRWLSSPAILIEIS